VKREDLFGYPKIMAQSINLGSRRSPVVENSSRRRYDSASLSLTFFGIALGVGGLVLIHKNCDVQQRKVQVPFSNWRKYKFDSGTALPWKSTVTPTGTASSAS
jgi:hypothetical protein